MFNNCQDWSGDECSGDSFHRRYSQPIGNKHGWVNGLLSALVQLRYRSTLFLPEAILKNVSNGHRVKIMVSPISRHRDEIEELCRRCGGTVLVRRLAVPQRPWRHSPGTWLATGKRSFRPCMFTTPNPVQVDYAYIRTASSRFQAHNS